MRVGKILGRDDFGSACFHLVRRLAGCQPEPVADPEDMRVDRDGRLAERMLSTTLAVLRPTPGSFGQQRRVVRAPRRHVAISACDSAMTFFALLRQSPIVRMYFATLLAQASIFPACRPP